jgi:phosphate transport system substrate-binding protein
MMNQPARQSTATAIAVLSSLVLCPSVFAAPPVVKIDGSSTVFPITEAVAEEFQKARKGAVNVTVGISGTGGGFKKFCRGETDMANASRPILKKEMDDCAKAGIRYYEMPIAYDALTVMVNPQNTFIKSMTVAELKKIWEPGCAGQDQQLEGRQPGVAGPEDQALRRRVGFRHLRLLHRSDRRQGQVEPRRLHGVRRRQRPGAGHRRRQGCARLLRLRLLHREPEEAQGRAIDGGKGPVAPTPENVDNGTYQPLSRPIFIYVSEKSLDKPEIKDFVDFYMKNARNWSRKSSTSRCRPKPTAGNLEHLAKKKLGTVFGGQNEVGLTIEQLMKREAQL